MAKPRSTSVRKSGIHGRGVFALRRIRKGETILRYRGDLVTHEEIDRNFDGNDNGHTFLFTLNEHYVIDGTHRGNSARWINHSCRPNCEAFQVESASKNPRRDQIVIDALRDIAPGEELTYDYHIDPAEPITKRLLALWACRCGAPRCRGTLLDIPKRRKRA